MGLIGQRHDESVDALVFPYAPLDIPRQKQVVQGRSGNYLHCWELANSLMTYATRDGKSESGS